MVNSSGHLQLPPSLERVVIPAAEAKASHHAVTPQLRPKGKVSLPVASSAPSRVRDDLLFNFECLVRVPCRSSSPAEQITTADAYEIGSLPLKRNYNWQVRTCFVGSARVAPSRPVREAPYRSKKRQVCSLR